MSQAALNPTALLAPSPAGAAAYATGLSKVYGGGETRVVALDSVTVDFGRGRFTAIMGPSGSGKSTLMPRSRAPTRRRSARQRN